MESPHEPGLKRDLKPWTLPKVYAVGSLHKLGCDMIALVEDEDSGSQVIEIWDCSHKRAIFYPETMEAMVEWWLKDGKKCLKDKGKSEFEERKEMKEEKEKEEKK